MKLFYLIAGTYRAAGMERALANKANWLASRGYDVTIVTTDQRGREPAFPLDTSIKSVDLGIDYELTNGRSFLVKAAQYPLKQLRHRCRLGRLLKAEKPDVTVCMFNNDAAFVPRIKDGSRKVLEVHFSRFKRLQYGRGGLWALADKWRSRNDLKVASRFDRFVVLTQEDRGYWGELSNIRVIPNARTFAPGDLPQMAREKVVLAAGRYSHQKHFDALIEAWRRINTTGWTLRIAGEGDSLGELPENVVTGPAADMKSEYARASIFALSSRYEGLPMVLLEAQAAGLPIVSFACKCGPRDVVTDGVDGFLVPEDDIASLAARLKQLMDDEPLRMRMSEAALMASERFDEQKIMSEWESLFAEL